MAVVYFKEEDLLRILKDLNDPNLQDELKKVEHSKVVKCFDNVYQSKGKTPNEIIQKLTKLPTIMGLAKLPIRLFKICVPQMEFSDNEKLKLVIQCLNDNNYEKIDFLLEQGFPEEDSSGKHLYQLTNNEKYKERFMGYTHKNSTEEAIKITIEIYLNSCDSKCRVNYIKKFIQHCPCEIMFHHQYESDDYYELMKILVEKKITIKQTELAKSERFKELFGYPEIENFLKGMTREKKLELIERMIQEI